MMRKILGAALPLALWLCGAGPLSAEVINRIAAVVNGEPITTYQVDRKIAERRPDALERSGGELAGLRKQALGMVIEETLIEQKVQELKIVLTEEEMAAAQADVERSNNLTTEQLIAGLAQQGMSYEAFRDNLRRQLIRVKLLRQDILKNLRVTDREINEYFRLHINEYRKHPSVRLDTVALSAAAAGGREEAVKQLQEVRQRLVAGEEFSAVFGSLSETPGISGGDLGALNPADLNPLYAAAIAGIEPGGISEVIDTPAGARLFRVAERIPGQIRKLSEVRPEIERKLSEQKTETEFQTWSEEMRKKARVEILL